MKCDKFFYSSVMRVNLFGVVCLLLTEESHKFWGICRYEY